MWVDGKNLDNTCNYEIGYKFAVARWGDERTEGDSDEPDGGAYASWGSFNEGIPQTIENELSEMDAGSYPSYVDSNRYIWQDVRLNDGSNSY